jgi:hypothetical protein
MILRAILWIAVVAILMPHEPDLGFGRPHESGLLDTIKAIALHRLIEVRNELVQAEQARDRSPD